MAALQGLIRLTIVSKRLDIVKRHSWKRCTELEGALIAIAEKNVVVKAV